ncbi:hypothetical protein R3P38DRAFT_1366021 [Favolaschia claudopus]|uniref:Uncharacterized protein n=1 Tax=Favolaschia claudopus TaxID=2862362 RepID=A0AAW0DW47_9AGAR
MATTTTPNLVPTIESTTLPTTPANEWADSTHTILEAHKPTTPLYTPGPKVPGSFPYEAGQENGGDALVEAANAAKTYFPGEDQVQKVITNAGQTVKAYLPESVSAFLSSSPTSSSNPNSELSPPRPAFASEDTDSSNLTNISTKAEAGSLPPLPHDSASTLGQVEPQLSTPAAALPPLPPSDSYSQPNTNTELLSTNTEMDKLSTTVHTGAAGSPHPVAPLSPPDTPPAIAGESSRFVESMTTPPAQMSASPAPLSSSNASASTPADSSSSSTAYKEGIRAPHNTLNSQRAEASSHSPVAEEKVEKVTLDAGHAPPSPQSSDGVVSPTTGTKKPKLVQRLKEKLHVGHSHASS